MFGQLVIIRQSFNPLLSGSVFLTSACVCSSEDIAKCFNPLLSGSVFLTDKGVLLVGFSPRLVSIPSLAGQFF